MDFQHWLITDALSTIKFALLEGIQDLGPEIQQWLRNFIAQWGERAAKSPLDYKRINWTMYWSRPENLERLADLVADRIVERGYDRTGLDGAARQLLSSFIASVLERDVGYGSRRNMVSARRLGAEPEAIASGDVEVPRPGQAWFFTKKHPTQAERWKQYRAERELSKIPVIDPETGEVIQPSVVPNFKPKGRPPKNPRRS